MPLTAYSYRRFSSRKQSKGSSLTRQITASKDFASVQGWELSELTFNDLGVSAFKGLNVSRGELSDFLLAVQTGAIRVPCALIVESLDRLSRDRLSKALTTFQTILSHGVTIATISDNQVYQPADCDDLGKTMVAMMNLHRSHEESKVKSDRSRGAWEATSNGERSIRSGQSPWWLKRVDRVYVIDTERARLVKKIFDMYLGGSTVVEIAVHAAEHSPDPARTWNRNTIGKLLNYKAVYGIWEYRGESVELYPPIVTEETFHKVQALRKSRTFNGVRNVKVSNIFRGLAKCSGCQKPLVFKRSSNGFNKTYEYLWCSNGLALSGCTKKAIPYQLVKEGFKILLASIDPRDWEIQNDTASNKQDIEEREVLIESCRVAIRNFETAIGLPDANIPSLLALSSSKRKEILNLQKEIDSLKETESNKASLDGHALLYAQVLNDIDSAVYGSDMVQEVNHKLLTLGVKLTVNIEDRTVTLHDPRELSITENSINELTALAKSHREKHVKTHGLRIDRRQVLTTT